MRKPWSISTTVRNAERIRGFLQVLSKMEGETFDQDGQIKFQTLLIQHKLYKPMALPSKVLRYYEGFEDLMNYDQAKEIFDFMKGKSSELKKDPGLRGRTSAAPLSKMGLCIAKKSENKIRITQFGKEFLQEKMDVGEVYFRSFLKWQCPNPDSDDFKTVDGFAIKPFIGTLHLINEVNCRWKELGNTPVGLTKEEFSLFVPTLISFHDISKQAKKIIDLRNQLKKHKDIKSRTLFKKKYKELFAAEFLGVKKSKAINLLLNNLKDYGDNTIRYFRLTRYIHIRGNGFYIDLEFRREVELDKLLKSDNAAPLEFKDLGEYRAYLTDINEPVLPWETNVDLKKIIGTVIEDVRESSEFLKSMSMSVPKFEYKDSDNLRKQELKEYAEELRNFRRKLQDLEVSYELKHIEKVEECIELLKNIHKTSAKKSVELERLITLALNALNDALEIRPNYPVGDDNEPTFTAPGNKPDIECFYENYNLVCEVTMLSDRSQWYNEGQPVMRHVRDFENKYSDKQVYCVFVAPRLHPDTAETFWVSIKHGYKGAQQKIIPLSLSQFIKLLDVLLEVKRQGKQFKHVDLFKLYEEIIKLTKAVEHSDKWLEKIPETLNLWRQAVLQEKK